MNGYRVITADRIAVSAEVNMFNKPLRAVTVLCSNDAGAAFFNGEENWLWKE